MRENSKQAWTTLTTVTNAKVSCSIIRGKNYSMPSKIIKKILARDGDVSTRMRILVNAISKLHDNFAHYGNNTR